MKASEHVDKPTEAGTGAEQRLSDLAEHKAGRILRLSGALHGAERRRLLDLGFVPGTVVVAEIGGANREPSAFRVRGALIALRREQTDAIAIERVE